MLDNKPLLSIIVHNYRTPQDTASCVEGLQRQTLNDRTEIIAVDSHSDDDSIGVMRNRLSAYPNVRIVDAPGHLGFGRGNNYGARYASGEYILILNPDTQPEHDALERLVGYLEEDESIGIIAPRLVFPDGTVRDSYRTFPSLPDMIVKRTFLRHIFRKRLAHFLQYEQDPTTVRDVDWVVGAFMLMKRDLFTALGGFDERFFLFLEDTDLCRRCWQMQKRVVFRGDVRANDGKQRLSGDTFLSILTKRTGRIHIVSAIKYFWKWRGVVC